jgi:exodeoxyribonuclease VII large subunit
MWRSSVANLKFIPKAGMAVLCQGRPNIYNKSGRFQIIVTAMWEAGVGLLQQKFLELKEKLTKEGLFSSERKRPLPFLPKAIGVVTSKSGAVIHDIMVKVKERFASIPVYLVDVRVQGPGAAEEIAAAIGQLCRSGSVDVIIVGRGGGSLEDLWAFNEEIVVRAIFAATIPVISAVGHESDISLADLVDDRRAPTPTAAAEMVVPKRTDLLNSIDLLEQRLFDLDRWFTPLSQSLDESSLRLARAIMTVQSTVKLKLQAARARLALLEPSRIIALLRGKIDLHNNKLLRAEENTFSRKRHSLEQLSTRLEAISPLQVLKRGYAVVESDSGLVRTNEQLDRDQQIKISFASDAVYARVEAKTVVNWRNLDE